jgi:hypothetical protein
VDAVGTVPRVARLLAVAHAYRGLLESGAAKDYADLARIAGVSRARVTQVMGLLHLAPDIQEAVLDLPRTYGGADAVLETDLRAVAALAEWGRQRRAWGARMQARN